MFPYADYQFYKEKGSGKLEEDEFNRYVLDASFFLRQITLAKSDKTTRDELKYAVCGIVDMYKEEREKYAEGVVKSENNDGYSVSFQTELKDGEVLEDLLDRKALRIARQYLLMTGLLSVKVGRRCDY